MKISRSGLIYAAAAATLATDDARRRLPRCRPMCGSEMTANDVANPFLLVYAGLFPIVNPIGGAPIFLGLTRHYCAEHQRKRLALQVSINSFFLLLGSLLFGSYVLEFFGITLPIVRIAGGLVVAATGWNLLQAQYEVSEVQASSGPARPTSAFYPLTMPITVGPGSIAVAITLGSQ